MITEIILKIFMIIMGLFAIVTLYFLLSSVNSRACYPAELFQEEGLAGFGGGIFDRTYDSVCALVADINSGLFEVFLNPMAELPGIRGLIISISNSLWGFGKFFCKTHTNFDYTDQKGNDAIRDKEQLLELFLYESERCWNMFEGAGLNGATENKNPIPTVGFFSCAEIIYELPIGEELSLKRIYDRIFVPNSCSQHVNIPKEKEYMVGSSNKPVGLHGFYWCLPKIYMEDYWYNRDRVYDYYPNSSADYCKSFNEDSEVYLNEQIISSSCLDMNVAMCSLGTSYAYGEDSDGYAVISGAGKITISYFDFMNWYRYGSEDKLKSYDNYAACGGNDVFNDFSMLSGKYSENEYYQNSIVVCNEKYDTPSYECTGTLDCEGLQANAIGSDSECDYASGCTEGAFWTCNNNAGSSCNSFKTNYKCLSNSPAGCSWESQGSCTGTLDCSSLGTSLIGSGSECDQASLCYEDYSGIIGQCLSLGSCSDISNEYWCLTNSLAGCYWER